ncbi:MAG: Veg family protein [Clostridia bacterium]|nr:Veg family protein [Clostridia bacterium]
MAGVDTLLNIKKDLDNHIGERVRLKANKGRRKSFVKEGIIEETYPSVFTVKIDDEKSSARRLSYSYSDVLTQTVELVLCRDNIKIECS